jgi:hypothetical protein
MLLATEANTVATTARADDQMRESADSNERGRPIDGAGQDSRAGGLSASTMLTGAQQPSGRRHASPVGWPAAAPTSTIIVGRDFGEAQFARAPFFETSSPKYTWLNKIAVGVGERRPAGDIYEVFEIL